MKKCSRCGGSLGSNRSHGCDRWRRIYGEAEGRVWWTGEWERECGSGCTASVRPMAGRVPSGFDQGEFTWEVRCNDKAKDGGFAPSAPAAKHEASAALRFFGRGGR